ncbi:MAG: hypothetical protein PUD93_11255 [Lachnospiraceae bacterium]|nr:hypothetical protein [Lachnospiraceae bacterium]
MEYDPLHGIMPTGRLGILLPYYGFAAFLLTTILYCRLVEKRNLESLGYGKKVTDYFSGGIIAVFLLVIIIGLCYFVKAISWVGINENSNITYIICLWIGFIFSFPHVFSLFETETKYAVIGIINLYLISIIFSLLMLIRSNIWVACGLHGTWNFVLYGIIGLSLSGSEINSDGIMHFKTNYIS